MYDKIEELKNKLDFDYHYYSILNKNENEVYASRYEKVDTLQKLNLLDELFRAMAALSLGTHRQIEKSLNGKPLIRYKYFKDERIIPLAQLQERIDRFMNPETVRSMLIEAVRDFPHVSRIETLMIRILCKVNIEKVAPEQVEKLKKERQAYVEESRKEYQVEEPTVANKKEAQNKEQPQRQEEEYSR